MASMVSMVSRNDSPFFSEDEPAAKESTSADSRLAAVSNERRVRVESSKKRVATVRPRRVGTLGLARRLTSTKESATSSTSTMSSTPRSSMDSRWVGKGLTGRPGLRVTHPGR
jgi:hypothetical protein